MEPRQEGTLSTVLEIRPIYILHCNVQSPSTCSTCTSPILQNPLYIVCIVCMHSVYSPTATLGREWLGLPSIALYYISLYLGNPNTNNKDHLVGQLTRGCPTASREETYFHNAVQAHFHNCTVWLHSVPCSEQTYFNYALCMVLTVQLGEYAECG